MLNTNDKFSSMKDVAELAGVSTATVSHVINETRYVSEKTKLKVMQVMKELDYRPNSIARSLRSSKSKTIALLVPILGTDTSNFFFMSIAQGIESKFREHGYHLILSNTNESIEIENEQIKSFNTQLIDGLIMAPASPDSAHLHETLSGRYPVVFIDRKPNDLIGDCVLADNLNGSREAVGSLLERSGSKVGFISGELGLTTSDARFEGYKQALKDYHFPFRPELVKIGPATFEEGYRLARELWETGKPSSVMIANNIMTMGAISFFNERKIKIPEEIKIIGYDDYDWAKITSPPLTVVKQPAFELGVKAAEALISRIEDPSQPFQDYYLPTELVIRESTN
ncbi:LacI family DNA-binding transcriptional regulator [Bacillus mangrovi]|uniref:Catabolite control protein A n=1 Tax=Metabacillus mangrovi TaxID=1491830 RepID=A0A7X2S843_9BACI|nr:LacI family DNA-binding transcriptional regulator [Metabacillus mangrovi]MTH54941.1 LacI family DNA-binding transcriptional regulator [Metabacillus mangrovi]